GRHSAKALEYAAWNAGLQRGFRNPIDESICAAGGAPAADVTVRAEVPYDFLRKRLTVQVLGPFGCLAITKGALKEMLAICTQAEGPGEGDFPIETQRKQILDRYGQLSAQGNRVLGIAYKRVSPDRDFTRGDETGMTFLGFIVLYDPP